MKKFWWMILVLVYIGVYLSVFPGDFYYDDYHSIRNNPWLTSLKNLPRFFIDPGTFSSKARAAMYRPVLLVSYAIDYQVYGWRVYGWHLTNLVLHFLNVLLVWVLVKRTFKDEVLSWFSGIIYAFHPVGGELINYVNCRSSILLSFFIFCGIYSVSRLIEAEGRNRGRIIWLSLANVFFVLGLLSKESAVVFPGVAFLYYWIFSEKQGGEKFSGVCFLVLPMVFLLGGYLFIRGIFFERILSGSFMPRGRLENLGTGFKSYFWYIWLFLFPARVSIEHSFMVERSLFNFRLILSSAGLILSGVFVLLSLIKFRGRVAGIGFLVGFYILVLLPTSSIVPLNVLVSERAFYPGLFSIAVLLGMILEGVWERRREACLVCAGVILFSWFGIINYRGWVWQDGFRLWRDAFRKAPEVARVLGELGNEYARRGDEERAIRFFLRSDELSSGQSATAYNLGVIYMDMGRLELAERYLEEAVRLEPEDEEARVNLGVVYKALGKMELARYQFEYAVHLKPDSALAHNNLGDLEYGVGNFAKAEREFLRAVEIEPDLEFAHYNLGRIYERAGLYEDALLRFKRAYEINPGYPDNSLQVGIMLIRLGKTGEAEEWIKKALALDSQYGIAWYYLGIVEMKEGGSDAALKAFEKALGFIDDRELRKEIEGIILKLKR